MMVNDRVQRRRIKEDRILQVMLDAVQRGMRYVSDTCVDRKLKSKRRANYLGISHFSVKTLDYSAKWGMMTERTEKGASSSRDPEGTFMVEAHVGNRIDGNGRAYVVNYRVPTDDQVVNSSHRRGLEDILERNISSALLLAGRDYIERLGRADMSPKHEELGLELVVTKEAKRSFRHIEALPRNNGLNLDSIFASLKDASRTLSDVAMRGKNIIVENPFVTFSLNETIRRFVNSDRVIVRDCSNYYTVDFSLDVVDDHNRMVPVTDRLVVSDLRCLTREAILGRAKELRDIARRQYSAPVLRDGAYPVMGGPDFTAAFMHEEVGHSMDTKTIADGWDSKGYQIFGSQIAPANLTVSMVDSRIDGGYRVPGSCVVDCEGVPRFLLNDKIRRRVALIKEGAVENYIADKHGAWLAEHKIGLEGRGIALGNSFVDMWTCYTLEYDERKEEDVRAYMNPAPRQPILEVGWDDKISSEKEAFVFFKEWLGRNDEQEGVFIERGPSGETTKQGDAVVDCYQGYLITPDSNSLRERPVKMFATRGSMGSMKGIVAMYGRPRNISFVCYDDSSGYCPMSIFTPGIIVDRLDFKSKELDKSTSYLRLR